MKMESKCIIFSFDMGRSPIVLTEKAQALAVTR